MPKGTALPVGSLFPPVDARLRLNGEGYSPALLRKIVSQGGRYAFKEAAGNLDELCNVKISDSHVLRLTERIGTEWAERRDAEIEAYKQNRLPRLYAQAPRAAAVMLDGGRAQTRAEPSGPGVKDPAWNEPKFGTFLSLNTKPSTTDPQPDVPAKFLDQKHVPQLVQELQRVRSAAKLRDEHNRAPGKRKRKRAAPRISRHVLRTVIATMAAIDEFGYQVVVEVYKRGLDLAPWKACVGDGQKSIWTVWEVHLKELGFIPILDFLHLLSYIYAAAHAVGGSAADCWARYKQWLTWAWKGAREKLMVALNSAVERAGEPPDDAPETDRRVVIARSRTYVANNLEKMDYPRYRKLGLPISSAPVESTIKQFNKRVKGTEKFWRKSALEAVLQVRAAQLCEDGRTERLWAMPRAYRPTHRSQFAPAH